MNYARVVLALPAGDPTAGPSVRVVERGYQIVFEASIEYEQSPPHCSDDQRRDGRWRGVDWGYWPVIAPPEPNYDAAANVLEAGPLVFDDEARTATFTWTVRAKTAEEIAAERAARLATPLTRLQFRRLLTFEERVAIDNSPDPAVITLNTDLECAEEVILTDAVVQQGVGLLIAKGLLTAARGARVLDGLAPL